eukprot:TRINITY_DN2772_c0_g1_i5.p1 TRINITY_DN2772_c0_g1~~TRINITY_DN2772_c0_g1_i5.p1  ORF type:complete len:238 (+),score=16.29 TRINITY_DN2772_c0_g1_i5:100-813(+)
MIVLSFLIGSVWMLECFNYSCNIDKLNGNVCAIWNDYQIELTMCEGSKVCQLPSSMDDTGRCIDKSSITNRLPGEYCDTSNQCRSRNCNCNLCIGIAENGSCTTHEDCDIELYCNSGVCASPTHACSAEAKCMSNEFCVDGVCHGYGLVKVREKAKVPALCESYYVEEGKCATGPKVVGNRSMPKNETGKNLCSYTGGKGLVEGSSICGMNENIRTEYCPLGRGDLKFDAVSLFLTR